MYIIVTQISHNVSCPEAGPLVRIQTIYYTEIQTR